MQIFSTIRWLIPQVMIVTLALRLIKQLLSQITLKIANQHQETSEKDGNFLWPILENNGMWKNSESSTTAEKALF